MLEILVKPFMVQLDSVDIELEAAGIAPVSLMSDKLEYGGNGKAPVAPNVCCPAANNALISEEWSCQFLCKGVLLHPGRPAKRMAAKLTVCNV